MRQPPPEPPFWRRNLGLKLLSVVLAFVVWTYVNSQGLVTVNFAIPIEPKDLSADLVLTSLGEKSADVRLRGRESVLQRTGSPHIHVNLDLSGASAGEQWITLNPADVTVPEPLEVAQVSPRQVRVNVERRVTRPVRVVADVAGEPAPGFEVRGIAVEPAAVVMTGAETAFEGLSRLRTQPVDITGLRANMRREVRLDLGGRDLEILEGVPVYVTITINPVSEPPGKTP